MTIPTLTPPPGPPPTQADPSSFASRADAAWLWLATHVTEEIATIGATNLATAVVDQKAADATASAAVAVAAAAAAIAAPGTAGTSVTPDTIGAGAGSLTIQTGKSLVVGMWIMIAVTASPSTNYMVAIVTGYNSGTGLLNFTTPAGFAIGSGTYSAWTVSLTGPPADAAALAANLAAAQDRAVAFSLLF